jgi:predicted ABC-type exoprotein transport system permease subunit
MIRIRAAIVGALIGGFLGQLVAMLLVLFVLAPLPLSLVTWNLLKTWVEFVVPLVGIVFGIWVAARLSQQHRS